MPRNDGLPTGWPHTATHPLPRRVAPIQSETVNSFLERLARANRISLSDLACLLFPSEYNNLNITVRRLRLEQLATVSGISPICLAYGLPEMRMHLPIAHGLHLEGTTRAGRPNRALLACRLCVSAKGVKDNVTVWRRPDENVCLRHGLWIGDDVTSPADQVSVSSLPEILWAQRAHSRMIRRFGYREVGAAYDGAIRAVDWSTHFPSDTPRWRRREYFGQQEGTGNVSHACDAAAMYPEVVTLARVLVSPYWRRLSVGDDPERERFFRQVAEYGVTNGRPDLNTPLQRWIDMQSWPWPDVPQDEKVALLRRCLPMSPVVEEVESHS
ncbi:TniQ family protein [Nonomuraea aurantiaca]|uniref:TniQ family protein n=1 Tax=Nonomuraea aurantiaca TaxID=2878562 RepID=UPI001CD9B0E7|nr:TniQ family protein [Nonomuraea aurantiaca]MCA2229215.1 TniQ family protein [Nonomuraea aurantiaca]